ncbi:LysR family transcriptional regulator [uncultured Corynebacterium sp.]|uniref:LysR family transcriptional regulator n=1 Tax=uncultured Corynebacterium sp. TaxID=159447 RepID=UPI0025E40D08|nr:LysR family transcriptional regulator [uncultured Corynebacterium sp.]
MTNDGRPAPRTPNVAALRLLAAVGREGGLGAAARASGIAQPNASRTIAALERELGVELLTRSTRGATVTPTGRAVLAAAGPLFDAVDAFDRDIDALTAGDSARLRISASLTVAENLVPRWLATYRRRHPGADVGLRVRNSERVFDDVVAGDCDIGFVETPLSRKNLHATIVADDHLVVVVSPDHPWARRAGDPITADELAATPLVLREAGSGTRAFVDRALAPWNPVPPAVEVGSNAAVAATLRTGGEPGVLSELAVADGLAHGDLVAVDVDARLDFRRRIRAVWRGAGPGRVAREFIDIAAA